MTSATDRQRILLAGCGKLGRQIGLELSHRHEVWGLRRGDGPLPKPIIPLQAELLDRESIASALPSAIDSVIYCLTPRDYNDEGYKAAFVTALDNLLTQLEARPHPPQRLFFISSTAVYHQDDDSWVDEATPVRPERFSGRRVLEGEQRLTRSPIPGTAIRFAGIYGGERRGMLNRIRAGKIAPDKDSGGQSPYTNRIHEADCVGVVAHLVGRLVGGQPIANCYVASDCEPVRQGDLVSWVRDYVSCAPVALDAQASGRAGSKRCSNRRLLASGYRFHYPTFREGYGQMLKEELTSTP